MNLLWRVGANTVRQCMHDGFEDCPTREQRQWVADAYLQMLVNFVAFGDTRLAARMLRQIAQTQRGDGLTAVSAPGDFAALTLFNIPDFCLYWILAIEAYVTFSGDTALARELYPAMTQALAWFKRHLSEEALLTDLPHWVFVDWAELDKVGQVTVLNVLFVAALRAAARLATCADAAQRAGEYRDQADTIVASINELLWDEARGAYVDVRGATAYAAGGSANRQTPWSSPLT